MFQLVRETHIQFLKVRRTAYIVSAVLLLTGITSILAHKGLRLGVDFAGGRLIEYRLAEEMPVDQLRSIIQSVGISGAEIQSVGGTGRDFLIRLPVTDEEITAHDDGPSEIIQAAISEAVPGADPELRREELVGPKVGDELKERAFWAVIISLAGILVYVGIRYEFTFAIGGVVALLHDVLLTLFAFSLFEIEISIPIVAALLTIGGYSINDTVVVYDRIREQTKLLQGTPLTDIIDISVNMTLSRTVITSTTTFFAAGALFFFGGEVLHDFAFAIMIGIVVGTYSTIYIASALALELSHKIGVTRAGEAPSAS